MRIVFSTALSVVAAACLVTSGLAQVKQGNAHGFSAAKLTALPTTSWPTNGGNLYNQRYSPLTAINRSNIGQLKGVWRARLHGSGTAPQYSGFAQPVVYDGVAYVSTGADDVFALSIDTGEILWQYAANLDPNITSVCCGWNNKGVAISDDKVFLGQLDGQLVALDRATGKVAWSIQAERWQENFSITAAPLYVSVNSPSASPGAGMVIIGFAGGDRGTRSRVKAYDSKDGRLLWTFYTIPGPGEPGHETWPKDNDAWKYGGAAIWQTPAVDPELGLIYFSTGNAAPDYNGAFRAGDNLYAASMLAIELATGKYRWHFQQVHHDIWDYDAVNPVVLMDVNVGGRTRKAIA
jgi:quinohemoprotein ethanol dehydrogenase